MYNKIVLFFFLILSYLANAQVDTFSRQIIDSVIVYKDVKKSNLFYYAPRKLQLAVDKYGKPAFKLIKMRYLGTNCSNDVNKSHTTNLLQLKVVMPAISAEKLTKIKRKLSKNSSNLKLRPIIINRVSSELLVPVKTSDVTTNKMKSIAQSQADAADSKKEVSSIKSYWTERTFTFKLADKETILLEKQLQDHNLVMSFSYAFYANTTDPMQYADIKTTAELKDQIIKSTDTISLINRVIFSDAFDIEVNLSKWPDLVSEIDINESMPPVYAAVEVKCYDFFENLRPDLYLKMVDVSAISVGNDKGIIQRVKFLSKQKDVNTHFIHFPFAVYVNTPLKYRVTEITKDGSKHVGKWHTTESCEGIIDITTQPEDLKSEKIPVEIEVNPAIFSADNTTLLFKISYKLNGNLENKLLQFSYNKMIVEMNLFHDIDTAIMYRYELRKDDKSVFKSDEKVLSDNYLYIDAE